MERFVEESKVGVVEVVDHRVGIEVERDCHCVAEIALGSFLGFGKRLLELIHAVPLH